MKLMSEDALTLLKEDIKIFHAKNGCNIENSELL